MAENAFSGFKEGASIRVGRMRKVQSSFLDKWRSMGKKEVTIEVGYVGVVNAFPAATGVGLAVAGASVAAATGIGLAGLGAALAVFDLVKQKYSNRERAHTQLSGHVWSLIDDVAPQPGEGKDLAAASLYLLREGVAQLEEMRNKLNTAVSKFDKFWAEYEQKNWWLTDKDFYDPPQAGLERGALMRLPAPLQKLSEEDREKHFLAQGDRAVNLLNTAIEQNGAVFELMRRLNHVGNYLQAPMIVAQYLDDENSKFPGCLKDQFEKNALVKQWRNVCEQRSDQLQVYESNFTTFLDRMETKYRSKLVA